MIVCVCAHVLCMGNVSRWSGLIIGTAAITVAPQESDPGKGFVADVTTACPAGTYSGTGGHTSAWPCTPCPAGRYSTVVGASNATMCRPCPALTPYSPPAASNAAACTSCASSDCGDGQHGTIMCPTTSTSTQWVPWAGRPDAGACVALIAPARTWSAANATCVALAPGARLLTPTAWVSRAL